MCDLRGRRSKNGRPVVFVLAVSPHIGTKQLALRPGLECRFAVYPSAPPTLLCAPSNAITRHSL
jgi:hypothetical protein